MRSSVALFVSLLVLAPTARADDAAPVKTASATPWVDDLTLMKAVEQDVQAKGILSVQTRLTALEAALANAKHSTELAAAQTPTSFVLTNGLADVIGSMAIATAMTKKDGAVKQVDAIADPYQPIAMFLGTYYDEVGKPDEALRVLELGLALASEVSDMRAPLLTERGAALMGLKRWDDVLANEDMGLKLVKLENIDKARFYRARGFALTELNRLDEAEAAYKESLNLEPGNQLATRELNYIHGLKMGGARASSGLTTVQKPAPAEQAAPANP